MNATYFNKGQGHSIRGRIAREDGGMAWSKLPANLRRGLTAAQAARINISYEWHHAGKYAAEVHVYYPAQVEAYWKVLDNAGVEVGELFGALPLPKNVLRARAEAINTAEQVRCEITGEEY